LVLVVQQLSAQMLHVDNADNVMDNADSLLDNADNVMDNADNFVDNTDNIVDKADNLMFLLYCGRIILTSLYLTYSVI